MERYYEKKKNTKRNVENVRRYSKTEKLEDAIESAVNALPDDSEVKELLAENLSEVKTMCITEYTQENADMLREIETQRRIDAEKKRTEKEKKRADEAEENLIMKDNELQEKNTELKKKDDVIKEQNEEIAFLRAQLAAKKS